MPKRKDIIDTEHYKIHWEHTTHIYSELEDYLRFMVHDGNIEKPSQKLYTMINQNVTDEQWLNIEENIEICRNLCS